MKYIINYIFITNRATLKKKYVLYYYNMFSSPWLWLSDEYNSSIVFKIINHIYKNGFHIPLNFNTLVPIFRRYLVSINFKNIQPEIPWGATNVI